MSNFTPRLSSQTRRSSTSFTGHRRSSLLASLVSGAEGRQSQRSRQSIADLEKEFLRPSLRPSTAHESTVEEETPQLTKEELEHMLDNCMKLTRDKQITEGRLWGLALPQHMPDLVKYNTNQTNFNFQKVIFGLDAAVQIYSRRVDSMHNSVLDTRCRLTTELQTKDETHDDEERIQRRRQKRSSQFSGDVTIATSLDQITSKQDADDDVLPIDPLFHRTSALFDAAGFKALPTLNLKLSHGGRYVLDTNAMPYTSNSDLTKLSPGHELDLEVFGTVFTPLTEITPISQAASKLYALLGKEDHRQSTRELILRGMNNVALPPREENEMISENEPYCMEDTFAFDESYPTEEETPVEKNFAMEVDGEVEVHGEEQEKEDLVENDFQNEELRFSFEVSDALNIPNPPEEAELLDEATISWLLDARHDKGGNKGRAWTGAPHWKYPNATKVSHDQGRETLPKKKAPKQEIDFTALPEIDMSLFKKPVKSSQTFMLFEEDAETLLPTDHKIEASFFLTLGLFPSLKPRDWLWMWQSRGQTSSKRNQEFPDDEGFEDYQDYPHLELQDGDDGFQMIEAPPQIEVEPVEIDLMPVKVDMKQLKEELWEKTKMKDMMKNSEVSLGLYFACSLHLAAEHGFHIVNHTPDEATLLIDPNTNSNDSEQQQQELVS